MDVSGWVRLVAWASAAPVKRNRERTAKATIKERFISVPLSTATGAVSTPKIPVRIANLAIGRRDALVFRRREKASTERTRGGGSYAKNQH
jgi:hypothetical protein